MAIITRLKAKTKSCYLHYSNDSLLCFEYPGEIYGKNHRVPTFTDKPKPIKIIVPNLKYKGVLKSFFVSTTDSIGVFFLPKNTEVYITKPVYEHLMIKLESLKSLSLSYDDEPEHSGILVKKWKMPNFVFISFNQVFNFNNVLVTAISAGTFFGFVNFLVTDNKKILYAKSIANESRFFSEPPKLNLDYLVLNRDSDLDCVEYCCLQKQKPKDAHNVRFSDEIIKIRIVSEPNKGAFDFSTRTGTFVGVDAFTEFIKLSESRLITIYCDFSKYLLEIVFHCFSVLKTGNIYLVGENFKGLKSKLRYMGEYFNSMIKSRMYFGHDPLPFSQYPSFYVVKSAKEITHRAGLVFYEDLMPGQTLDASINSFVGDFSFFIPFEMSLEAIKNKFYCDIVLNSDYITSDRINCVHSIADENRKSHTMFDELILKNYDQNNGLLEPDIPYIFETGEHVTTLKIKNTDRITMHNNKFIVEGKLCHTDFYTENVKEFSLEPQELNIKKLFLTERYFLVDGYYWFVKSGIKIKKDDVDSFQ